MHVSDKDMFHRVKNRLKRTQNKIGGESERERQRRGERGKLGCSRDQAESMREATVM